MWVCGWMFVGLCQCVLVLDLLVLWVGVWVYVYEYMCVTLFHLVASSRRPRFII